MQKFPGFSEQNEGAKKVLPKLTNMEYEERREKTERGR